MKPEKVIIIGGGPAGLAAAIYNARAELNPLVFAGSPPGGQLTLTSSVENYPGFESILGPELIGKIRKQAEKFGARFIDQNVTRVDFSKKPLMVYTSDQADKGHESDVVLVASGAEAVWLGLPSEQRLRGKGVSVCATCDGFFFKDKMVAVVGGGDAALEEALTLTKFAQKVYIIYRRDQLRASKILQNRVLKNSKIEIIWNTIVEEIMGENRVEGVKLRSVLKQGQTLLSLDGLFVAIGHMPVTKFLKGSRVILDEKGYIITSGTYALKKLRNPNFELPITNYNFRYQCMTSVPGVFSAGDVVDSNYKQAITAAGMGVSAALEIERYLRELGK